MNARRCCHLALDCRFSATSEFQPGTVAVLPGVNQDGSIAALDRRKKRPSDRTPCGAEGPDDHCRHVCHRRHAQSTQIEAIRVSVEWHIHVRASIADHLDPSEPARQGNPTMRSRPMAGRLAAALIVSKVLLLSACGRHDSSADDASTIDDILASERTAAEPLVAVEDRVTSGISTFDFRWNDRVNEQTIAATALTSHRRRRPGGVRALPRCHHRGDQIRRLRRRARGKGTGVSERPERFGQRHIATSTRLVDR